MFQPKSAPAPGEKAENATRPTLRAAVMTFPVSAASPATKICWQTQAASGFPGEAGPTWGGVPDEEEGQLYPRP